MNLQIILLNLLFLTPQILQVVQVLCQLLFQVLQCVRIPGSQAQLNPGSQLDQVDQEFQMDHAIQMD